MIQIHLMFLFIKDGQKRSYVTFAFKYISCSYLSPFPGVPLLSCSLFKYISCSYLSFLVLLMLLYTISFKYISCSYLSQLYKHLNLRSPHSNTSHVLIYRLFPAFLCFLVAYSNTSHVLIYLYPAFYRNPRTTFKYISCSYLSNRVQRKNSCGDIQIHLMFLFIQIDNSRTIYFYGFKYISCSYLSELLVILIRL